MSDDEKPCEVVPLQPPPEGEVGRAETAGCDKCGGRCTIYVARDAKNDRPYGQCANGGVLRWRPSGSFGMAMRGPGASEGSIGMRKKKSMIEWNEKLARKQWDDHAPMPMASGGGVARNPTPDGPLDPDGRFGSKKAKPIIILPK